jgi:hypothetical protein
MLTVASSYDWTVYSFAHRTIPARFDVVLLDVFDVASVKINVVYVLITSLARIEEIDVCLLIHSIMSLITESG